VVLADVFGKKPENQIAVLLKQSIFTAISPVGVRIAEMLATVQFDGDSAKPRGLVAWRSKHS
jgi:hypothetical protein